MPEACAAPTGGFLHISKALFLGPYPAKTSRDCRGVLRHTCGGGTAATFQIVLSGTLERPRDDALAAGLSGLALARRRDRGR